MDSNHCVSTQNSVPSPDGALIATLQQSSIRIITYTGTLLRSISIASELVPKCRHISWSRPNGAVKSSPEHLQGGYTEWECSRILLADEDSVHVYHVNESSRIATIERASGNVGRISHVAFGHSANDILVFSDLGIKLIIWSLVARRGVEIKDPKIVKQCYSLRPQTGHLALLTRPASQDILMLLDPKDYSLIKSVDLSTVDAQEVIWNPDGQWLAVRDTASSGHRVLLYTADGHLFKTYSESEMAVDIALGIKCFKWNHGTGCLALGDYNDHVTILGKNTFSALSSFHHPATITLPNSAVWQEQLSISKERSYSLAPQPANPPSSTSFTKTANALRGVSIITFSSDGTLLATKSDSMPSTVWIWSLNEGVAVGVLIHHSPIKSLSWHPTESDLLLVLCAIPRPSVHLWKSSWESPRIVSLPLNTTGGKLEAQWLLNPRTLDSRYQLILSSAQKYATTILSESGEPIRESQELVTGMDQTLDAGAEVMFDEGHSLDLSPIKITHDETVGIEDENETSGLGFEMGNEMVDDTFHYRRHVRAVGC